MQVSKNNIIVKVGKRLNPAEEYVIFNPLTGNLDILDDKEHQRFKAFEENSRTIPEEDDFVKALVARGYLFPDQAAEEEAIKKGFEDFQKEIRDCQPQLLIIPTYDCNLKCVYCYEKSLHKQGALISKETVDSLFNFINEKFSNYSSKPFITLFGGEPLINSKSQKEIISYIVSKCKVHNYQLSIVTNGYELISFIDTIKQANVKEIQVTLDGCAEQHDSRRSNRRGKGTFSEIVSGIEAALELKMPINLRTVVDKDNIEDLVNLANFINNKGWLDLGNHLFKTQIGRNYELYDCYHKPQHLMTQVELWRDFAKLAEQFEVLKKFHRPDFKGIRHLIDTGNLYMASYDTCPATKTEWVFDLYGDIYGCTASCGREEFKLGSYLPEGHIFENCLQEWQERNVLNIPECRNCCYNLICGGGCGVIAANKTGKVLAPDCRPIQELIEIGINYYYDEINRMASD